MEKISEMKFARQTYSCGRAGRGDGSEGGRRYEEMTLKFSHGIPKVKNW